MKKNRLAATLMGAVLLATSLAGCSLIPLPHAGDAQSDGPASPAASAAPSTSASAHAGESSASAADLVQPGATVPAGQWMTYEFVNYDNKKAVLQSRVTGITPATEAQLQLLISEIPQLKGYRVALITFEQRKVSGDDITFDADYTDYKPASTTGAQAQEVSVIGWDDCPSASFTKDFNDSGATIASCVVAATVEGGDAAGGLLYTGPMSLDDNPFSSYGGKPVFMKG